MSRIRTMSFLLFLLCAGHVAGSAPGVWEETAVRGREASAPHDDLRDRNGDAPRSERTSAAVLRAEPPDVNFGRVRYGEDACAYVELTNTGTEPLNILAVQAASLSAEVFLPETIPPGGSAILDFCEMSETLGLQHDTLRITFKGSESGELTVPLTIAGWDSLNIALPSDVRGRPGSIVHLPVRLHGLVPAEYGVRSLTFELRYNKTLLYPIGDAPLSQGTLIKGMRILASSVERRFTGQEGQAIVSVEGDLPLINPVRDSVLLILPFLVLHGDALETEVRAINLSMNSGVPALGLLQPGRFFADSIDFHEQRLIDSSPRYLGLLVSTFPNPAGHAVSLRYHTLRQAEVSVAVYDFSGRCVLRRRTHANVAGRQQALLDLRGLPGGSYFFHIMAGGEVRSGSFVVLR